MERKRDPRHERLWSIRSPQASASLWSMIVRAAILTGCFFAIAFAFALIIDGVI